MAEPISIVSPLKPHNSTCGYCGPPGQRSNAKSNYRAAECMPLQLSCRVYQEMIDRGWRRSGVYCYQPDLKRSCCPQYTIRLDALEFKPTKSQRKVINRWNRFIVHGDHKDEDVPMKGAEGSLNASRSKGKGRREHVFNLTDDIHSSEVAYLNGKTAAHKYEVILEPSSYTEEKFALYDSYQKGIHKDEERTPKGFRRFLVQTALRPNPIHYPSRRPNQLPADYGSYHQLHRLDGKLIAMSIIDILPNSVSSVYFMYEKEWEKYSLGKLSAMREAALVKEIHAAGVLGVQYLYMGFYIHSCVKMRYKADYTPSYLADPEEYTWFPMEKCRPLLDRNHYATFAHPEHSLAKPSSAPDIPPECPPEVLQNVQYITGVQGNAVIVAPLTEADEWIMDGDGARTTINTTLAALGHDLSQEVLLDFRYDMS